jgi:hypothetical protein
MWITAAGCGGSPGGGGSGGSGEFTFGGLRGEWDVAFTRGEIKSATLSVGDRHAAMIAVRNLEGSSYRGCTRVLDRYEITTEASVEGDLITGSVYRAAQDQGSDCYGSQEVQRELRSSFSVRRVARASSSFGSLGGEWELSSAQKTCRFTFTGSSFTGHCQGTGTYGSPDSFSGTFEGARLSGSGDNGVEFAAQRR